MGLQQYGKDCYSNQNKGKNKGKSKDKSKDKVKNKSGGKGANSVEYGEEQ